MVPLPWESSPNERLSLPPISPSPMSPPSSGILTVFSTGTTVGWWTDSVSINLQWVHTPQQRKIYTRHCMSQVPCEEKVRRSRISLLLAFGSDAHYFVRGTHHWLTKPCHLCPAWWALIEKDLKHIDSFLPIMSIWPEVCLSKLICWSLPNPPSRP